MTPLVTGLYASLLALLALFLGGAVGAMRGKKKISLGDGGDEELIVANRRHMNFVESVPFALLLMALIELSGAPKAWLHYLGAPLVLARLIHPFGLYRNNLNHPARIAGAALTALVTLACAGILIWMQFK